MDYLLTLQEYKSLMGITNAIKDAQVTAMIPVVADLIDTYLGWNLIQQDHTEVYDGTGNNFIRLRNKPINSVTSVTTGYNRPGSQTYDNTYFTIDAQPLVPPSGMLWVSQNTPVSAAFSAVPQSIQVTYNAGYEAALVPSQLKWAACLLISRQISQTKTNLLMSGLRLDQYAETVSGNPLVLPENNDIKAILDRFKTVRFIV